MHVMVLILCFYFELVLAINQAGNIVITMNNTKRKVSVVSTFTTDADFFICEAYSKINGALTTTFTAEEALPIFEANKSRGFSITMNDALSSMILGAEAQGMKVHFSTINL